ncbi:MAG: hypothetical protein GY928_04310, partial [Colwellia sp.]|nr:hypothetical protein [Colwellia sp.]
KKFNAFAELDSPLFLDGTDEWELFCDRIHCEITNAAKTICGDGSWTDTPLMGMKCEKRNHYRMQLTLYAVFKNENKNENDLCIPCVRILFRADKPSKEEFLEPLLRLKELAKDLWDIILWESDEEILCMLDYERPMRGAFVAAIKKCKLCGCWFHLLKKIKDCTILPPIRGPV